MKVVLFCGGLGTRLREHSSTIPKPLVTVGHRPVMWHLMRYYAHYGHRDFVLALGYRGDLIREFFLNYQDCMSTDFVWSEGGKRIEVARSDVEDWRITFVDTGLHSNIGQRLMRVRKYVDGEETFLANYSDGLSDLPLDQHIATHHARKALASFAGVRPAQSFHSARSGPDGIVTSLGEIADNDLWVNGGFFVLSQRVFDYMQDGEELVEQPFQRLIAERRLAMNPHQGFWQPLDTLKDKITLDRLEAKGNCPWMVWTRPAD
jgi:glucose-1-phosphate cytidylyltransferase